MALINVVLPTPGPPAITENGLFMEFNRPSTCFSFNTLLPETFKTSDETVSMETKSSSSSAS